jgi:hypothetical protein
VKIFPLLGELPPEITPYLIKEWKYA